MKNCKNKECTETNPQPLANFFNDKGFKSGKMAICKTCKQAKTMKWREANRPVYNALAVKWRDKNPDKQHATDIKRIYGLRIERYNQMLTDQKCKCAICGKPHDPSTKRGRLYVDHCHKTEEVRGLLCSACNSGIGHFNYDLRLLQQAINYIRSANTREVSEQITMTREDILDIFKQIDPTDYRMSAFALLFCGKAGV